MDRNRWASTLVWIWIVVVSVGVGFGVEATPRQEEAPMPAGDSALHPSMAAWEPYLGTWEIDAEWAGGGALWSRGVYVPFMDGRFVRVKTYVRDGDGPIYLRYDSVIGVGDEPGTFTIHNFIHDGKVQQADYTASDDGSLHTRWAMGETEIKERLDILSPTEIRWQVWTGGNGSEEWARAMDGTWRLTKAFEEGLEDKEMKNASGAPKGTRPVDSGLFVGSGPDVRGFELEETFAASPADVFAAFSDGDAFVAAYGPERDALKASIDLAIGGRYEWLFDGEVGSNDCQVLAFAPGRMIAFTWNAPPQHGALRDLRTWVVVQTDAAPGGTAVRLGHWGFGDGAEWDETETYFKAAWAHVLGTLKKNLEAAD